MRAFARSRDPIADRLEPTGAAGPADKSDDSRTDLGLGSDGGKRRSFSKLAVAQAGGRLGLKYRLSKQVYAALTGQPITAAHFLALNGHRIAKLVRNAG